MSASPLRTLALGTAAAALVTLAAGCGSSATTPSGSAPQSNSGSTGSGGTLKTGSTSIGTVLVDPSGRTVYELVGDSAAHQTCTGSCLATWPAVMSNGTQVVVNGHPAFTFAGDSAAGKTTGQNVTDQWGRWLALDANGNPISAPTATATTSAPGGGGPAF
ncbi:MAG: hypothetical protein JWQ32_3378 [Marmoricola sp.]|nr:hypothetical protein [Marmoricola sp.]